MSVNALVVIMVGEDDQNPLPEGVKALLVADHRWEMETPCVAFAVGNGGLGTPRTFETCSPQQGGYLRSRGTATSFVSSGPTLDYSTTIVTEQRLYVKVDPHQGQMECTPKWRDG